LAAENSIEFPTKPKEMPVFCDRFSESRSGENGPPGNDKPFNAHFLQDEWCDATLQICSGDRLAITNRMLGEPELTFLIAIGPCFDRTIPFNFPEPDSGPE
jgi:hypothetical protein